MICFLILWSFRKRIKIWGLLFSIYLIINGIERFLIERIRVNERYEGAFDFSQAQMVSIGFILVGLITAFLFWKQHQKRLTIASAAMHMSVQNV